MEYKKIPDFKSLAALSAIFELGGVSEAGKKLNIGQPAISKRLKALEEFYGVDLVHKHGRQLKLTLAGEKIYQFARLMLDHHLLLFEDLSSLRLQQTRLRIEVTFSISENLLPDILYRFSETFPQYQVVSRIGYSRRIQTRLATGLCDMALLEKAPDHQDILVQKWFDDELILVCYRQNWVKETKDLTIKELSNLQYILREPKSTLRIELDNALNQVGINSLNIYMEIGSTDAIIDMLGRGQYFSFLPLFAVKNHLDTNQLLHIKVQGLSIKRTLWIARTRSNINNPVSEAFIELLRQ